MELAIVLIIALIVFGPKKLPELGKSLGKGMREFKSSISGDGKGTDHQGEAAEQARLEATTSTKGQATPAEVKPADA
jgi:sec-independent protein translocase protein TatA